MRAQSIPLIGMLQLRPLGFNPPHVTRHRAGAGQLMLLDFIGNLIRDNFPAFPAVIRDGIGIKITDMLSLFLHVQQCLLQQPVHQAHVGILRIGAHAGQPAHAIGPAKNPHLHGVYRHLGNQVVPVEPSQHIRFFHSGKFGPDDLLFLPANGG